MKPIELKAGQLVRLNPEIVKNKIFAACIMIITEPKSFGAQGYVQVFGENGNPVGKAYYRALWDEMEFVGQV